MRSVNNATIFKFLEFYGLRINHRGKWRIHNILRNLFKVNPNHDFDVKRDGLDWLLNPADSVQRDVFWYGVKDVFEIFHIKRFIKPGDIVFDVGANFGYYSIKLAALLEGNCKVYAFEPCPPNFQRLSHNVNKNNLGRCVFPFELGFSDVIGNTTMSQTPGNSGGTYVTPNSHEGGIQLQTIDHFCRAHNITRIDFMKIDVEGLEPLVLKGAIPYFDKLRELPVILIELNPECLQRAGFCVDDILRTLGRYNYTFHVARRKELVLMKNLPVEGQLVNAFCLPRKI
jgi:FkbM family methyltransferase